MSEPASKPEEHDRPPGHPADKPWPPKLREYPFGHPALSDEESTKAFNEDWAREDFGNAFVDGLIERNSQGGKPIFKGDWWMLAMLMRCAEVANERDPNALASHRFAEWDVLYTKAFNIGIRCHLEHADLSNARLQTAELAKAHLEYVDFEGASLEGARLALAHLKRSRLHGTKLDRAHLAGAHFEQTAFLKASLKGADLMFANLQESEHQHTRFDGAALINTIFERSLIVNTRFSGASLERASLVSATIVASDFERATLKEAVLTGADIRGARRLRFDANRVRDIHIEGNAPDPWSVLRRKYTGPMFFVHAALLLAFVLPYVGKVLALTAADHAGRMLGHATDHLPQSVPIVVEQVGAWRVLIGLDKGWWVPTLGAVLLVYNGLRGLLTIKVGQLRDAEDRSGITPTLFEYMGTQGLADEGRGVFAWRLVKEFILWVWRILRAWVVRGGANPDQGIDAVGFWRLHRLLRVLFFIAIGSFVIHGVLWVMTTTLPKVRVVSQGDAPPPLVQPTD